MLGRRLTTHVEVQLLTRVRVVDPCAPGRYEDIKDVEGLQRRTDMARASGTPIQFLWGNTEFARDESLRVSHRVQTNDVEVTRLRFPAREGADEEEPLTFEYIVGLPRALDLSTKLETGSEAAEVHSSSRIGVRESWPAA